MIFRSSLMLELVFVLVGGYFVALPAFGYRSTQKFVCTQVKSGVLMNQVTDKLLINSPVKTNISSGYVVMSDSSHAAITGYINLHILSTAYGVKYRVGNNIKIIDDLSGLRISLKNIVGKAPGIKILVDKGIASGMVFAVARVCVSEGFKVAYANSISGRK